MNRSRTLGWLAALLVCTACEPEPWSTPSTFTNVPWVQDNSGHWYLIDTGSPRTLIGHGTLDQPLGAIEDKPMPGWDAARLALHGPSLVLTPRLPTVLTELEAAGGIDDLGGIVGADLLFRQAFTLDPDREEILFASPPLQAAHRLRLEQVGGGDTCFKEGCYSWGANRALVELEINGTPSWFLLDTGATFLEVETGASQRLGLEPVTHRSTENTHVVGVDVGYAGSPIARVAAHVANDPTLDAALARLSVETGRVISGLAGHTLLRDWVARIDMQRGELELGERPGQPLAVRWVHPGLKTVDDPDGECWTIGLITMGSSAEQVGLELGECVTQVDGFTPDRNPSTELDDHFIALGPGGTVAVETETATHTLTVVDWLAP